MYSQLDNFKPNFKPPSITKKQDVKVLHTILFHRGANWLTASSANNSD